VKIMDNEEKELLLRRLMMLNGMNPYGVK